MSYSDKLNDPRWQRKSAEIKILHDWTCDDCTAADKQLHVHHKYYTRNTDPWDYPNTAFKCLCNDCHDATEHALSQFRRIMGEMHVGELAMFLNEFERALKDYPQQTVFTAVQMVLSDPILANRVFAEWRAEQAELKEAV